MGTPGFVEQMRDLIGQEVGVSDWFLIDQTRIDEFCECTEDFQWIHTDPAKAAVGPYGTTIAPGFLAVSLVSAMSRSLISGLRESRKLDIADDQVAMFLNYGMNKVRFLNPIPVNSKMRSRIVLTDVHEKAPGNVLVTTRHTMELEGEDRPVCVVEFIVMFLLA